MTVQRNPGLTSLSLNEPMSPETVLSMLTHDLPSLQKLYYADGCAFDQHITKVLLETLPGSI